MPAFSTMRSLSSQTKPLWSAGQKAARATSASRAQAAAVGTSVERGRAAMGQYRRAGTGCKELYSRPMRRRHAAAAAAVLAAAALAPALRNGFVNWDDRAAILDNPALR